MLLKDLLELVENQLVGSRGHKSIFSGTGIFRQAKKLFQRAIAYQGLIHLNYQGGGRFFYSYRKNETIKTGLFRAQLRFILPVFVVFFLASSLGWGSYFILDSVFSPAMAVATAGEKNFEAGGFTKISAKEAALVNVSELVISDEDEKKKNALLGITPEDKLLHSKKSREEREKRKIKRIIYHIKPGESLSSIAHKFRVSIDAIAGSSGIRVIEDIRVGQQIYIPSKEGFFYKIRKGDRLGHILQKYKVKFDKFVSNNLNIKPDLLELGAQIFLPGAKPGNLIRSWFVPVASRIITSGYGWRRYPRRSFHKGLDLKAIYSPVRAARAGIVTYRGWLGGYGNVVVISHGGGYKTLYAHLSRIYVRKGKYIGRGRVLGRSGNTGYSFGPHLHFEVSRYGRNLSPHRILKGLRYSSNLWRRGRRR